jgi:hypothetical protein
LGTKATSRPPAISDMPVASATTLTVCPTASEPACATSVPTRTDASEPVAASRNTMTLASPTASMPATVSAPPAWISCALPATIIPDPAIAACDASAEAAVLSVAAAGVAANNEMKPAAARLTRVPFTFMVFSGGE